MESRLRAWLRIDMPEHEVKLTGGERVSWNEYCNNMGTTYKASAIVQHIYRTKIINSGSLPALEVTGKEKQSSSPITHLELSNEPGTKPVPLMAGEYFPTVCMIEDKDYPKTEKDYYYFGIVVEYKIEGSKEVFKVGKIWRINSIMTFINESWI